MQNRYAGDLGDFFKLALIRLIAAGRPGLRTGLVWCLVPDEAHNSDGKHISYLRPGHAGAARLQGLDPALHDALVAMLATRERSVLSLELSGALPTGSVSFADPLASLGAASESWLARRDHRRSWLGHALAATRDCEVVFFDPDNGFRSSLYAEPSHRRSAVKHIYTDELQPFVRRGQSVVVYHHADRSATVAVQAQRRLRQLEDEVGGRALCAVRASRGSVRLFLVLAAAEHLDRLTSRLRALDEGDWRGELDVIWPTR